MAWFFELAVECGPNRDDAILLGRHFDGQEWVLADGTESCSRYHDLDVSSGDDGNWWCVVAPSELSSRGIASEDDARRMTEVGFLLYERLKSAPPYRFAAVGVETLQFNDWAGIKDLLFKAEFNGFVMSQKLWEEAGAPSHFELFAPGYRWKPYLGEKFRPYSP